mgnify:CR=1 FL=1
MPLKGQVLGKAILNALGIDPAKVRSVSLHADARGVAMVKLEMYAPENLESFDGVMELLRTSDHIATDVKFIDRHAQLAKERKRTALLMRKAEVEEQLYGIELDLMMHNEEPE